MLFTVFQKENVALVEMKAEGDTLFTVLVHPSTKKKSIEKLTAEQAVGYILNPPSGEFWIRRKKFFRSAEGAIGYERKENKYFPTDFKVGEWDSVTKIEIHPFVLIEGWDGEKNQHLNKSF